MGALCSGAFLAPGGAASKNGALYTHVRGGVLWQPPFFHPPPRLCEVGVSKKGGCHRTPPPPYMCVFWFKITLVRYMKSWASLVIEK